MVEISKARQSDLAQIKAIADANRDALGFIPQAAIASGITNGEVVVARISDTVVGFQTYHHRKRDLTTKLYFKCVTLDLRRRGIARCLVDAVAAEARTLGRQRLVLKCPVELPSNSFHARYGFVLSGVERGKRRDLNIWEYRL